MPVFLFIFAALCAAAQTAAPSGPPKPTDVSAASSPYRPSGQWKIRFNFDRDRQEYEIKDIAVVGEGRVIAVGLLSKAPKKPEGLAVLTKDDGKTWTEMPLKEWPISLYFLNDSIGWMVTDEGIWQTVESGLSWRKLKGIKGVERVYFLDENRGWAVGAQMLFMATTDGGKTWSDVPEAKTVKANPDYTAFHWINFVSPKNGVVNGLSVPPRRSDLRRDPDWADPAGAATRRQWPNMTVALETGDGGKTWLAQTAPIFGRPARFKFAPDRKVLAYSLALLRFDSAFEYPSEVYLVNVKNGKSERTFREKNRRVTDVGWLDLQRGALVAVEPRGLYLLPVPGKLHVLETDTFKEWHEMAVDWKAYASEAILATAGDQSWIGTDTGLILQLVRD